MRTKNTCIFFYSKYFMLLTILFSLTEPSFSQEKIEIVMGIEESINSSVLNEERNISIYLPDNYSITTQNYPVLYLLDGRTHFQHAIGAVNFLSNQGTTPQMIVVSIHNVDRTRDFSPVHNEQFPTSGGAELFLNFLSNELVPYINNTYRTSGFTILMGHSFGGTFAAYTLLTVPDLFDAYIAASPFLQYTDNHIVKETNKLLKSEYNQQKYFYITIGNEPDYYEPIAEFTKAIEEKTKDGISLEYLKMADENHATIPYPSLFKGLKFIFSEWQLPREKFEKGLVEIDSHYNDISLLYGFEISTPENIINILGYTYLQNNNIEKAIEVFKENVKRNPTSANVYDSLGEAYEKNNELELATENYQKAVDLGMAQNDANTQIFQKNLERVQ